MVHELKILPGYFDAVKSGAKRFELRENDRNYKVGDAVIMREWNGDYTGNEITATITYVLKDCPSYGLMNGYCILGIKE